MARGLRKTRSRLTSSEKRILESVYSKDLKQRLKKLSSRIVSTNTPQSPSSQAASLQPCSHPSEEKVSSSDIDTPQSPSTLALHGASKALLQACSTQSDHLKGSDQYQTTRHSEQKLSSSDILTHSPQPSPSSITKKLPSCSKKRKR